MEYPEFLILRLRRPGDSVCLPVWLKLFPKRYRKRMIYRWLYWKLPLYCRELDCLDQSGEEVFLPFDREDLDAYTKEEITDMLHRIIIEKAVQNMVVDAELEPFLEQGLRIDGGMIPLLMLDDIVSYVCKKHQIARRELKPVVIASNVPETFYVLGKLGKDLNRLTIVTDEPEEYEDFVHTSYEEQGLLVRVAKRPLKQELYGNLILELSLKYRKDYQYYPVGSVVLNLSGNRCQVQDILLRRNHLVCYNRFDICVRGKVWDNRILQAVIYKTNTRIGIGQLSKGEKIKEIYGFKVEKAGIQS